MVSRLPITAEAACETDTDSVASGSSRRLATIPSLRNVLAAAKHAADQDTIDEVAVLGATATRAVPGAAQAGTRREQSPSSGGNAVPKPRSRITVLTVATNDHDDDATADVEDADASAPAAVTPGRAESPMAAAAAVIAGFLAVLVGGCLSFALFELATLAEPDCRNMLTSFQFLSTAVSSFAVTHLFANRVPLYVHGGLAGLHAGGALLANTALAWGVPTPLFLVIRNGNLVANIATARVLLKRTPTIAQYCAVATVTGGIMMTTIYSMKPTGDDGLDLGVDFDDVADFGFGLALLVASLFVNALLSLAQEHVFSKYVPCRGCGCRMGHAECGHSREVC